MQAFFATITKAGKFKWELDLAANRAGKPGLREEMEYQAGFDDPFASDGNQAMEVSLSGFHGPKLTIRDRPPTLR